VTAERRPVVMITGASSGIGAALAHEFAAHGHELVLIARREQALTNVAEAITAKGATRPTVLRLDVGRVDAARDISEALAQRAVEPEIVVNNAGFGLMGAADKLDRQRQLAMIDINIRALTELSLAFIESIERRKGGILNVASISGFMPGPGMAVYYATKAYSNHEVCASPHSARDLYQLNSRHVQAWTAAGFLRSFPCPQRPSPKRPTRGSSTAAALSCRAGRAKPCQ
jgi:short-subunit dehydrogenase